MIKVTCPGCSQEVETINVSGVIQYKAHLLPGIKVATTKDGGICDRSRCPVEKSEE